MPRLRNSSRNLLRGSMMPCRTLKKSFTVFSSRSYHWVANQPDSTISLFEFDAHTPKIQFSKELEEMYSQRRSNAVEGLLRKLQVCLLPFIRRVLISSRKPRKRTLGNISHITWQAMISTKCGNMFSTPLNNRWFKDRKNWTRCLRVCLFFHL